MSAYVSDVITLNRKNNQGFVMPDEFYIELPYYWSKT